MTQMAGGATFVGSVITRLREGFWPLADEDPLLYPETRDFPERPLSPRSLQLAQEQCAEEERFSAPFVSVDDPH
jgi:hypothetical protein